MSIDPLKTHFTVPLQQNRPQVRGHSTDSHYSFEQQLQRAQQSSTQKPSAVAQAEAVLKMAHLQLWQGLFADDDDLAGGSGLFNSFALLNPVAQASPRNQPLEKFYQTQQPSVLKDQLTERGEIEKMIDQVAEAVNLAPELIRSVVAAESDFQPQAVSVAGAEGLMQLMPATAEDLGVQDSFDPEQNLLGGSRYLKQLLDKYDGDLDKTLAAYNWGQGNVDRKGLELMPQETRDYLTKVKGKLNGQA